MNQHTQTIYGVVNCAFYNRAANGDIAWHETAEDRDAHLSTLRARAIKAGLSKTAAQAGIYPTSRVILKRNRENYDLDA
ncbi:hypothetical protein UFOVP75_19 [uncultured Caudovirales phage]|uniref:Uncharacterized protein n=1 Tax=uncultured Caudovirales phage TaxID=2100421 RepID=A0A6J5KZD5_9CAUD|nr:hypothetical protein UFOVP75_19 [uncultured Caudovirales phage]